MYSNYKIPTSGYTLREEKYRFISSLHEYIPEGHYNGICININENDLLLKNSPNKNILPSKYYLQKPIQKKKFSVLKYIKDYFSHNNNNVNNNNKNSTSINESFNQIFNLNTSQPSLQSIHYNIIGFSWHPTKNIWAIALNDHTIRFYNVTQQKWLKLSLSHQLQKNIIKIQWNKSGNNILAVSTINGICLWNISLSSAITNVISSNDHNKGYAAKNICEAWMNYLNLNNMITNEVIKDIDFSPCGRYLSSCTNTNTFIIWDIYNPNHDNNYNTFTILGSNICLLKWSLDGSKLITITSNQKYFRIWNTYTWTNQLWSCNNIIQDIIWHNNNEILLMSCKNSSKIYTINLSSNSQVLNTNIILDLSINAPIEIFKNKNEIYIQKMLWNKSSKRLIISFQQHTDLLAVFNSELQHGLMLRFSFIGFIKGPSFDLTSESSSMDSLTHNLSLSPVQKDESEVIDSFFDQSTVHILQSSSESSLTNTKHDQHNPNKLINHTPEKKKKKKKKC